MSAEKKKRRRGLWWKIPLWLVVILVVFVVVVWANLSTIITKVANAKLPEVLGTEASVEKIEVKPLRGLVALHGLSIAQPEGFGDGQAIELGRVLAKVDMGSLKSEEGILIEAIELQGLTANIDKDSDGVINLARLGPPSVEGDVTTEPAMGGPDDDAAAPEDGDLDEGEEDGEVHAEAEPFPGIRIQRVAISDIAVNYTDQTTGDKPIDIALGNLDVQLADGMVEIADSLSVRLATGTVTLEDIHIAQPAGYGEDALLVLPRVQLDIGTEPFVDNVVRLERLELSGLRAHIARDTNSVMNVARLGGGPPPEPPAEEDEPAADATDEADTSPTPETVEEAEDTEGAAPVGIYLGELALTDFAVTYSDAALAKEPMEFVISDLGLSVKDLMVFMAEPPTEAALVELQATLGQSDLPAALLTVLAKVGPVGAGVPDVNAQAKLSGFMLDTVGPLIPPGVRETIGADGLGLEVDLALTEETIDLTGTAITDKGHDYPVVVRGPLSKPALELGIFGAVAGRLTGGALNLAGGTAGATLDVAKGATGGAVDLAKGAGGTVGKVGGGLFGAVKAAATLDLGEVVDGVEEATVGAVKEAGDAVQEASDTVVDTSKEGMGSVTGSKATTKWLDEIPERHAADVEAARAALMEMPFPPPPLKD